jgi:hypothetical protein
VHHPARELRLAGEKVRILYQDDLAAFALNEDFGRRPTIASPLRGVLRPMTTAFYFATLFAAGLGLARWAVERQGDVLVPLISVGVITLGHVVFFAEPRFHLPLIPVFCALAGDGLAAAPSVLARVRAR